LKRDCLIGRQSLFDVTFVGGERSSYMGDGKKTTSMAWFLGQIGGHKREYVWSVILAIVGVGFSIVPYFFAIKVINGFMRGEKNIGFYL